MEVGLGATDCCCCFGGLVRLLESVSSRMKVEIATVTRASEAAMREGRRYLYVLQNGVSNHRGNAVAGSANVPPIRGLGDILIESRVPSKH